MKKLGRIISRIFLILLILILVSVGGIILWVLTHEDEILTAFKKEINKQVQTEILIKDMQVSFWESFPDASIHIENMRMKGSHPTDNNYLAHFNDVYLDFNIVKLLQEDYSIERVHAYKGGVFVFVDSTGVNNYSFYKSKDTTASDTGKEVRFRIDQIELKEVAFVYHNAELEQIYAVDNLFGVGKFDIKGKELKSKLTFSTTVDKCQVGEHNYFSEKKIKASVTYIHNLETTAGKLQPSRLTVNGSRFNVDGKVEPKNDRYMFEVKSYKTNVQTLLSLLPNDMAQPVRKYKTKGEVKFSAKITKQTEYKFPKIHSYFGLNKVSFKEPNTNYKIENVRLIGEFTNGEKHENSSSVLKMTGIKGSLNGKKFGGALTLSNFDDLRINTGFKGDLDLVPLARFLNQSKEAKLQSGTAKFDFHLNARVRDLKAGNKDNIKSSGEIAINDMNLTYRKRKIKNLFSHLIFNNNSIAIADLSTHIENSDFKVNGLIVNPFSALLRGEKEMYIEMNCMSDYIEADSLVRYFVIDEHEPEEENGIETDSKEDIQYLASLRLVAKHLKFNQFNLKELHGELAYHHGLLTMPKLRFKEADGLVEIQSKVDLNNIQKIDCDILGNIDNVNVQKVFTLFENFDQDFIIDKNLAGKMSVDFKAHFNLDKEYVVDPMSVKLTAACRVDEGKLLDFEPMQKMSTFIKREELANISFESLENTVSIDKGLIDIPEMDIQSNVSNIVIKGTHTFDQKIDYRLKIPLKNFSAPDKDAAFGAIQDDGAESVVHLKITGTTDDYKIAYDGKATKEKIKQDIKDEFQELKKLIKGKMNDSIKQTELEEDEYFEFE